MYKNYHRWFLFCGSQVNSHRLLRMYNVSYFFQKSATLGGAPEINDEFSEKALLNTLINWYLDVHTLYWDMDVIDWLCQKTFDHVLANPLTMVKVVLHLKAQWQWCVSLFCLGGYMLKSATAMVLLFFFFFFMWAFVRMNVEVPMYSPRAPKWLDPPHAPSITWAVDDYSMQSVHTPCHATLMQ